MEDYFNNILESNKFDMVKDMIFNKDKQKKVDLSNADNLLYLYSKNQQFEINSTSTTYQKIFLDYNLIDNKNKKYREIPGFGHFDLVRSTI